jgi:hypothetical protein
MGRWNRDFSLSPDNLWNDLGNVILLRSDIHTVFDERKFVLFPKSDKGFVVHMLEPTPDLAQLYHNVEVHPLMQCSPQFIFARFAWAIFPSLSTFISKPGVSRYLRILKTFSTGAAYVEEEISGTEKLRAKVSASRSRSPKKRQRAAEQQNNDTEDATSSSRKKRRRVSKSSSDPSLKTPREDLESMIPRAFWTADQRLKYTKMELPEEQLAEVELEEDLDFQRKSLPHFAEDGSLQGPPAWYPGWRRIQRLKDKWRAETRPPDFTDERFGEDANSQSGETRSKDVRRALESMGVEIVDDLDSNND